MQDWIGRGWRTALVAMLLLSAVLAGAHTASAAQAIGTTYTSPQYAYTISWPEQFTVQDDSSEGASDRLSLGDEVAYVYFTGSTGFSTPADAAEQFTGFIQTDENYSNVSEITPPRCASSSYIPAGVVRCFQVDRVDASGLPTTEGLLLQSWDMGSGVTLIMLASAEITTFDAYLPLFGQIAITPAGTAGTTGTTETTDNSAVSSGAPGSTIVDDNGITFTFDAGLSDADRNDAVEGTRLGVDVIVSFVGQNGLDDVRIDVSTEESPGGPYVMATTRGQSITVYTGGEPWQQAPQLIRIKAMVHELMHIYQNALEQHSSTPVPLWFDEGTAEALGYLAITRIGVVDQSDIYQLNQFLLTQYPVEGSLANLVPYNSMSADSYPLAYIAVQYLLGSRGMSVSALTQVYEGIGAGQTFAQSFQAVFGVTPEGFYVDFDSWRTGMLLVDEPPADFVIPSSSGQPAAVAWDQIPPQVNRGDQLMLVVTTVPGASCTVQLLIPGNSLQRVADANGEGEAFWIITIPDGALAGQYSARASCGGGPAVWQDVVVA